METELEGLLGDFPKVKVDWRWIASAKPNAIVVLNPETNKLEIWPAGSNPIKGMSWSGGVIEANPVYGDAGPFAG